MGEKSAKGWSVKSRTRHGVVAGRARPGSAMAVLPEPTVGGVYGTGTATAPVAARRASSANRDVMRAPEQIEAPIIDGSCCSVPQGERGLATKVGPAPSFANPALQ